MRARARAQPPHLQYYRDVQAEEISKDFSERDAGEYLQRRSIAELARLARVQLVAKGRAIGARARALIRIALGTISKVGET